MSLRVWLPLNGTLDNQGLDDVIVVNNGATVDNSGKIGKCYNFNGNNSYISLSGDILYSIIKGGSQPFSIAMWVYHADDSRAILFGDYGLDGKIDFNIELTAAHEVRFYWSNNPSKVASSTIMTQNTWNHLVIIYDGTKIVFYKNGLKTSDIYNNSLGIKTKTSGNYYLGRDSRTGNIALNGKINDFRIYDHALSSMEVKQISQGLVLHYPLNNIGIKEDIEYDCSGYCNNGIRTGNFQYDNDTPKYNVSTVFSASSSVIKIPNSNYAIQGSQNMTISVWVYKEDWSQYVQRIYSCTESGGLNIQLSSNNMQWAVNVYTDAEKTSHKYASSSPDLYIRVPRTDFSSGWHMFTWVYTTSGTSLYVDGVLKQSKTGTSYGLYFHSTAPLILGGQATSTNYSSPYLDGKLSDFRIYVTALSAEDILALYKNSVYIDNEGNLYGMELREV